MRKNILVSLILLFCTTLYGQNISQQVTLNLKDATLEEFFKQVERQTSFSVIYRDAIVKNENNITINAVKKPLREVLTQVLSSQGLVYEVSNKTLVILKKEQTSSNTLKNQTVLGNVIDETGQPVIGANVSIQGTTTGTTTDIDGNFSLKANPNDVLVITYIGYSTKTVKVGKNTELKVNLSVDAQGLDEVVVMGYGTQKKASVTAAVVQVSSKELIKAPMPDVTNMMTGKLPGLISKQLSGKPGESSAYMSIRGASTFNDSSALLLVDGVERNFFNMDPNEIESISVLKDASAAAVYGMRAAHGVIMVTTKRGSQKKAEITYNGSYTVTQNTRFPEFLNGPDYARWYNIARDLDGYDPKFSEEDINRIENGDPDGIFGNTNWIDQLFKNAGGMQQHNVSVSGGNERVKYYVNGGFLDQQGIVRNTSFKRYNVRSNIDIQITDNLSLALDLSQRIEDKDAPGYTLDNYGYANPITQALRALPILPETYNGLPTAWSGESGTNTYNPRAAVDQSGFTELRNSNFWSSASLTYAAPFLKGLKGKMFFTYDRSQTDQKSFLTAYEVQRFSLDTKSYTQTLAEGLGNSSLWQASSTGQNFVIRPSVEYTNTFGKHTVGALFLYELNLSNGRGLQASRRNYILTDIPELQMGGEDVPNSIIGERTKKARAGYVGRLNYAYDSKYLAEFAFRYDGSFLFAKDHRWGFFPSASFGWLISEEDFFKNAFPNVDKLKIRVSSGILGKDNISNDAMLYKRYFEITNGPSYAFGTNINPTYALYTDNAYPSTDITWEKTSSTNVGVELTMWNGLLTAEFDAFYKYTWDILENVAWQYPTSLGGYYATKANSGEMDVRGLELTLGHRNTINEFTYGVKGNISWARNKLLKQIHSGNILPWQNSIGQPLNRLMGYIATGLYQTQEDIDNAPSGPGGEHCLGAIMYKDLNGDGKIDENDKTFIGRSDVPEMMFALTLDAQWRGFDISAMFQGAALCDLTLSGKYNNSDGTNDETEFTRAFYGNGNSPYFVVENSWRPDNPNAEFPRLSTYWRGNNGWANSWWVRNGSYLRLKDVTIGYTVPKNVLTKTGIQNLRVYVSGTNLFTLDHVGYLDPEMPSVTNGYYPQQKTYSVGLNVTF